MILLTQVAKRGEVLKVKVLGAVALIDEGNNIFSFIFNKMIRITYCLCKISTFQ